MALSPIPKAGHLASGAARCKVRPGEMTMATVTVHRGPAAESGLAQRLRREIEGEFLFDAFSRGRYSTDASIYQIEPLGVVIPETSQAIAASIAIAREEGVPVLPRGGGTSQC